MMDAVGEPTTPLETPLRAEHERLGARFGEYFGARLPERYDAFEREYLLAREAVALFDTGYQAVARLDGPDRVRYLNAVLTSNVRDLEPGQGALGLLLDSRGHILAEIYTYALADHLLLLSHAMLRERTHATLDKFIIMDDATLTDLTDRFGTLALEGPGAPELLRESFGFDLDAMAEGNHRETSLAGIACRIARRTHFGQPGVELIVERGNAAALWQALLGPVGAPVGYAALDALRLEAGIPWFGADYDDTVIPHEAGVDQTHIDYTKGCYTGQEIVERVRSRGQVNRLRVALAFSAGPLPAPGAKLSSGGKEVGHVTSAAPSPALGRGIGMGYVRREHAAPGSQLDWEGGKAEVLAQPARAGAAVPPHEPR
jgi:folate-binding protein YgfZ